jgi:hypothetical protein
MAQPNYTLGDTPVKKPMVAWTSVFPRFRQLMKASQIHFQKQIKASTLPPNFQ